MNNHEPLVPDEPRSPGGNASGGDDLRTQRRRMIRTILLGGPAVVVASARAAHAGDGNPDDSVYGTSR